ncbi:MAG: cupredoxin domain-containing protein [Pseudomonadota bacterium]
MTTPTRRQFLKFGLTAAAALPVIASAAKAGGHAVHQIEITGFAFQPEALEMQSGDKVMFVNLDGAPHTATDEDGAFDTGTLNKGEERTIVIEKAGTYNFFCKFHPGMRGRIVAS